jgi:hypothetical protein
MRGMGMYNDIFYSIGMIMGFVFMASFVALFFIPMIQNFVESGRRKWYSRSIKSQISANLISTENGKILLDDIEQKREHTLYKSLKLYYTISSLYFVFTGAMFLIASFLGAEFENSETMINILYFSPIIYGSTLFLFYLLVAPHNRLLGEAGTLSLFLGSCVFIFGFTSKFEITFIRGELLIFTVLTLGLFLIYRYKAILVSYLYALILTAAGISNLGAAFAQEQAVRMSRFRGQRDFNTAPYFDIYDGFLPYFYWLFAAALLFLWHKRFKTINDITIKEIFFGIFAFLMIMSLSIFVTGQYWIIGGAIGLFLSFIYSSYYFEKSDWFISKPIHFFIIFLISLSGILGNSTILTPLSENIQWFGFVGASAWIGIFAMVILLGIGGTVLWFKFIIPERRINYILLSFPLVLILGLVLGASGGSFIFILYLLSLGGYYTWCGLSDKNEPYIFIGTILFIQGITIKIAELFTPEMPASRFGQKDGMKDYISNLLMSNAIMFILFGVIFAGMVYFLRENWKISGVDTKPTKLRNPALIDDQDSSIIKNEISDESDDDLI